MFFKAIKSSGLSNLCLIFFLSLWEISTTETMPNETRGESFFTTQKTELPPIQSPLVYNHSKEVPLRDPCNNITLICVGDFVECRNGFCKCHEGYVPRFDNRDACGERTYYNVEIPQTDPTMIGVVIGLALMSVTLCVVLRLFAKARFRENRTIFNTPNPRLMNVSLMKGSNQFFRSSSGHGRRGSSNSITSSTLPPPKQPPTPLPTQSEQGTGVKSTSVTGGGGRGSRPMRQMSTDTYLGMGTSSETPSGSRAHINKNKFRQDSLNSNV